ncbi:MAG: hypothetical protein ABIQ70_04810 [Dokdonella sp.]
MFTRYVFVPWVLILSFATAHAALYTVGADGACTHTTIAAAISSAEAHPGADTIQVASNQNYTAQAIAFTTGQQLAIVGGFADCSQLASDGSHGIIDGAGGITDPVFRITVNTGGLVQLSYLTIQHGDEDGSGKGGGVYFKGNGILELNHAAVTQNIAGYGGGIYAEGTGTETELVIGVDVAITGNIARFDGGGVVNDGTEMTMVQADSYIANNHAPNGYGGGLYVRGDNRAAYTYLGSSGFGSLGPIYLNDAQHGGGVALRGGDQDTNTAELQLFTTDPARPMRIRDNIATIEGGGVYGQGSTILQAWYAWIDANTAPHGAAIAGGEELIFNIPAYRPSGSSDCPVGAPCGGIVNNSAVDDASQPVGGIVEGSPHAANFNRMMLGGNTGKFLCSLDDSPLFATNEVAITGNTVSDDLIVVVGPQSISLMKNTTIADNAIGGDTVLKLDCRATYPCELWRSIVWQPGKATIPGAWVDKFHDLFGSNPRFVDPEHGDYSLRAGSPAVDDAPSDPTEVQGLDLYSRPRDIDMPIVDHHFGYGSRDLGAIERPTLQPLVLNSDFDTDLRLWNTSMVGLASLDTTRNASGATGSGSVHISSQANAVPGTRFGALVQCVHLPGPGVYALNGWGHGTGTMVTGGDVAELYWEYRKNGGEACTDGVPDASGTKILSNSNSWSRPATPALITVAEQDWSSDSSIVVTLVAEENGASGAPTNAWFDGVTLNVGGDDVIFANGFDGL